MKYLYMLLLSFLAPVAGYGNDFLMSVLVGDFEQSLPNKNSATINSKDLIKVFENKGFNIKNAQKIQQFIPLKGLKPIEVFYKNRTEDKAGKVTFDIQILIYDDFIFILIPNKKHPMVYQIEK